MNIILYSLQIIQQLYKQNCWLINFICRYIPLKQWAYDDSHSPKYQKFKVDHLPKIIYYEKWDCKEYIPYLEWKYGKKIKPVKRRSVCDIDDECFCPAAMLLNHIYIGITVPKDRFSAKYALLRFLRMITASPSPTRSNALTAIIHSLIRKTESTLSYINA